MGLFEFSNTFNHQSAPECRMVELMAYAQFWRLLNSLMIMKTPRAVLHSFVFVKKYSHAFNSRSRCLQHVEATHWSRFRNKNIHRWFAACSSDRSERPM